MNSGYKINLAVFLSFLFGFIIILISGTNKSLFLQINSFTATENPFIWANLTFLGDALPASTIMLLFIRKRPDLVWAGIFATIISTLTVNLIKYFSDSLRPAAVIDKDLINIIGPVLMKHSFLSGHTVTIFTLAGLLIFNFRFALIRLLLILLALFVGISRIAVGAHWPADVFAGAALGSVCAAIAMYSVTKLQLKGTRTMQIIIGLILISACVYLLCFYDSGYKQTICLKDFLACTVLVAGIREYYFLLKAKYFSP